jgi:phosphocarrier protein FPr
MLSLTSKDITLNQQVGNKTDAIKNIAHALNQQGYVGQEYQKGMLNREEQGSTYLGNGIAIPHGTTDTRDAVLKTGVAIHHFPQGVEWGQGNTVYLAIGIAAKSDEHLEILKQLTHVLSNEGVEETLAACTTEQQIVDVLNGDVQFEAIFDTSTILLNFPASDMFQMTAVGAGLIQNCQAVGKGFISDVVAQTPTHIQSGLWMVSSGQGVNKTALSFVTPVNAFECNDQPVRGLLTVAACNDLHMKYLQRVASLVQIHQIESLFNGKPEQVIALLAQHQPEIAVADNNENSAVYTIKNTHGLHARPGAMLVATTKKFESTITVINLNNGDDKAVNAKSLMKVIGLGVKHGHELKFIAKGCDASEALSAIGDAINSRLGEG